MPKKQPRYQPRRPCKDANHSNRNKIIYMYVTMIDRTLIPSKKDLDRAERLMAKGGASAKTALQVFCNQVEKMAASKGVKINTDKWSLKLSRMSRNQIYGSRSEDLDKPLFD